MVISPLCAPNETHYPRMLARAATKSASSSALDVMARATHDSGEDTSRPMAARERDNPVLLAHQSMRYVRLPRPRQNCTATDSRIDLSMNLRTICRPSFTYVVMALYSYGLYSYGPI